MEIFKNEVCKLITRRTVVIFLTIIVINILLQLYNIKTKNTDGYSLMNYSEMYREVGSFDSSNILEEIEERENKAVTYGEYNLYNRIYKEINACINYNEYLDAVDEKADDIAIMNRFVDDNRYAVKNARKTNEVYQKLREIKLKVHNPMAVLNITDNELTDYLALIMIFVVALNLVFYEKTENQFGFLRTTVNGRKTLMLAKVVVMCMCVVLVIISLYGINAIISRILFGSIDFEGPIQSIFLYYKSPFRINIGVFLVRFILAKFMSCILIGLFFMLINAVFNNVILSFVVSALTVLTELVLYTNISSTSFFVFAKYLNIMYGVKTGDLFADYVNVNLFGNPVNTCFIYWILWLILIFFISFKLVGYLETTHDTRVFFLKKMDLKNGFGGHTSLFLHESYKLFVMGKCFIIILAFSFAFIIWWNPVAKLQFDSVDEIYYKDYMDVLYGPLDSNKNEMINAERKKYEQLFEDISADYARGKNESYFNIKYKEELSRQDAFKQVIGHVEYLETVVDGWLFFDKGYNILTNKANFKNRDVSQAFVYVIMLIAMTFGLYGLDYSNSEVKLLRTTYRGRGKLKSIKGILGILCTFISFALVYIVHTLNILRAYGTAGINAPAASMEHLAKIPDNISVLQYILIIMLMRFISGLIVVMVISILFKYCKKSIPVLTSAIVIFIIPLILVALDVNKAQYILFNPLLLGNVF